MPTPVIGVTGPRGRGWPMWLGAALSIIAHGALPRRLTAPLDVSKLDGIDGLVIGGGDNISADLYRGEAVPEARLDPERDRLELDLLARFWESDAPILGICRGAQMLNVFRGGDLHEDAWAVFAEARRLNTPLPIRTVRVDRDTRLSRLIGRERMRVNSLHRQAINRPGETMRVCAHDDYGMTQAVEHLGPALRIGVQWHPEFLLYRRSQRRLFGALVREARAAKTRRKSEGEPRRSAPA